MNFFTKLLVPITFLLSFAPSAQGRNHVHDPSCVFHPHPSGLRAIDPKFTTRANLAHVEGVKGQTRTGKRLTAAIIDSGFHPAYTLALKQKKLIHPAVFQHKFILPPDIPSSEDRAHGSGVMEALHLIAPEAQLFPMDVCNMSDHSSNDPLVNLAKGAHRAIQEAIEHKVDVINISTHLDGAGYYDRKCFDALKQAIRQGIVVVFAAGNDSSDIYKHRLSEWWNDKAGAFHGNSRRQQFFNEMKGNGLLFAGSLSYSPNGEERLSDFSQIGDHSTNSRFFLAPGHHLPIRTSLNPHKLTGGTSFSSPVVAGGYLLLKQYVLDKRYAYGSSNALLDILHRAGNDYSFSQCGSPLERFKSLNIHKALRLADERFGGLPQLPAEPDHTYGTLFTIPEEPLTESTQSPKPGIRRLASPMSVVRKPAAPPQKTIVARSAVPQKSLPTPVIVERPVVERAPTVRPEIVNRSTPAPRATVMRQPAIRPVIERRPTPAPRATVTRQPAIRPTIERRSTLAPRAIVTRQTAIRPAIERRSIPAPRTIVTRQPVVRPAIERRSTPAPRAVVTRQPTIRPTSVARRQVVTRTAPARNLVVRARSVFQRQTRSQPVSQGRRR
jgi:hypothetical protein